MNLSEPFRTCGGESLRVELGVVFRPWSSRGFVDAVFVTVMVIVVGYCGCD